MKSKTIWIIVGVVALILIIANWNKIFGKSISTPSSFGLGKGPGVAPGVPKPGVGGGKGPLPGVTNHACSECPSGWCTPQGACVPKTYS